VLSYLLREFEKEGEKGGKRSLDGFRSAVSAPSRVRKGDSQVLHLSLTERRGKKKRETGGLLSVSRMQLKR